MAPDLRSSIGLVALAVVLALPASAEAQRSLSSFSEGQRFEPLVDGLPDVPGGFTFCRLQYDRAVSLPSGYGWSTDYPRGDFNLSTRLAELTTVSTSRWDNGDPGMAVVRATDPELYRCPFLFTSDPGSAGFSEAEVLALGDYLLKGGFLWVDDFWGDRAWSYWSSNVEQILPDHEIVDVPPDHPLMSIVYQVDELPQVPNMQHWRRTGDTSELGRESTQVNFRAVFDDDGRIMLLMTHNTDVADGWEREMDDDRFFLLFSPDAYAIGINVLVWMMTH